MSCEPVDYVGRFAPSPTGPLHFGSLLAAVASYAQAKSRNGRWLVRIEDIDPPRQIAGSDKDIIATLQAFGFEWDEPVSYQSEFRARHEERIDQLLNAGLAYPCACSRRDLAGVERGPLGAIYPGTCRSGCTATDVTARLRTNNVPVAFQDGLQGPQAQRLEAESGDFVIKRRGNLIAYHLAVVSDDFDQGVTEIVRGIDLLDSTPRQIFLQRQLGLSTPNYMHIPVAVNSTDQKLSKLTGATGIGNDNQGALLTAALQALRQDPPMNLAGRKLASIWRWAVANWNINRLLSVKKVPAAPFGFG